MTALNQPFAMLEGVSDFKDLKVFQKSHRLMLRCHRTADKLRSSRFVSLKAQIRRAAESIPANIVESRGQESRKEEARFLRIALNSTSELEYHVFSARELLAIGKDDHDELIEMIIEVRKMLYGLLRYLRTKPPKPPPNA